MRSPNKRNKEKWWRETGEMEGAWTVWVCERAWLNRNLVRWSENWHGRGHRRSKLFS